MRSRIQWCAPAVLLSVHSFALQAQAAPGKLTIDDNHIKALAGQPVGDQRARDAAANDQRIAFQAFAKLQ